MALVISLEIILNAETDIIPSFDAPLLVASHTDVGRIVFKN